MSNGEVLPYVPPSVLLIIESLGRAFTSLCQFAVHNTHSSSATLRSTASNARGKPHFIFIIVLTNDTLYSFSSYSVRPMFVNSHFLNPFHHLKANRYSVGFGACTQNCKYTGRHCVADQFIFSTAVYYFIETLRSCYLKNTESRLNGFRLNV